MNRICLSGKIIAQAMISAVMTGHDPVHAPPRSVGQAKRPRRHVTIAAAAAMPKNVARKRRGPHAKQRSRPNQ